MARRIASVHSAARWCSIRGIARPAGRRARPHRIFGVNLPGLMHIGINTLPAESVPFPHHVIRYLTQIITPIQGLLTDQFGSAFACIVPAICSAVVLSYALYDLRSKRDYSGGPAPVATGH